MPEEQLRKTFSTFRGIGNANSEFEALKVDHLTPQSTKILSETVQPCIKTSLQLSENSAENHHLTKQPEFNQNPQKDMQNNGETHAQNNFCIKLPIQANTSSRKTNGIRITSISQRLHHPDQGVNGSTSRRHHLLRNPSTGLARPKQHEEFNTGKSKQQK